MKYKRWLLAFGAVAASAELFLLASGCRILINSEHVPEDPDLAQEEGYHCTYFDGRQTFHEYYWAGLYDGCPWLWTEPLSLV